MDENQQKAEKQMKSVNRMQTQALATPRSKRNRPIAYLSSAKAGVCHPVGFYPLLREDACTGGVAINVEMLETSDILLNPVNARFTAYLVPMLAFERFNGNRDELDKSYAGEAGLAGAVIPFIETQAFGAHGANPLYKYAGLHGGATDLVNTSYIEAYNLVWNFRARNRSMDIAQRLRLDTSLAPAFFQHSAFAHIVPDFDQAVIDGEVALNVVAGALPVKGLGFHASGSGFNGPIAVKQTGALGGAGDDTSFASFRRAYDTDALYVNATGAAASAAPLIYAEMEENGITVSLSNLEMARKTQAFAELRKRYEGHDDEYITDMLMSGLTIPEQHLKQPILLADKTTRFGQSKRKATNSEDMTASATSGATTCQLNIRVPRLSTGGVIVVVAEFFPEPLFERQPDWWLYTTDVASLPEYVRDELDPEKVDVVLNRDIDVSHTVPLGTFGYEPLHAKLNRAGPNIGGKFSRPTANTLTDDDRQRLWAIEDIDPALSSSFYLVEDMHNKVFLDSDVDAENFEMTASGNLVITGNTRFGGLLVEATNNYEKIEEKQPVERIDKA